MATTTVNIFLMLEIVTRLSRLLSPFKEKRRVLSFYQNRKPN